MAQILYSQPVCDHIYDMIKRDVTGSASLTIYQVEGNSASDIYVRNKVRACDKIGLKSEVIKLDNDDSAKYTFLPKYLTEHTSGAAMLQLPLPDGWDEAYFTNLINPAVDADCLTHQNLGAFYASKNPHLSPCTAQGIIDILDFYNIEISGKRALVIGRSNIVGKPIAHLLTCRNATVTIAHTKTKKDDLLRFFATSDLIIVATGQPDTITEDDAYQYSKDYRHDFYNSFSTLKNRVIIDVGINRDKDGKLCGDLSEDFKAKYSSAYSPVPGGVGPLTVANLIKNAIQLNKNKEIYHG